MWFSFWRSRDRFSLEELRHLKDQLQNVHTVNDINKDYVIESLRSIAELVTYGDQHDPAFFDFFMEKQIMEEFVRILKISRTVNVAIQLLQTMSIMIQNFKSEHAIYYIFSNEHINHLITYSFDFGNEELLSYYISILRAISGKLNKDTISLLVKTQNDEVVSFPLYIEAIRFAFHEESMVRIAIRAITLNVYHVGDECVNRYVTTAPLADYFSNLVTYFRKQCINLDQSVYEAAGNPSISDPTSYILSAVDEIEDTLYYFSDIISSGVPNLGRLITDNILQHLVFPLLLPTLKGKSADGPQIRVPTTLFLLSCILRIVKTKDLASSISAALFCPPVAFIPKSESIPNGDVPGHGFNHENQNMDAKTLHMQGDARSLGVSVQNPASSHIHHAGNISLQHNHNNQHLPVRDILLMYIVSGDDKQVLGSLRVLATLLQTKELDESMLDALGILPQRKQHKKLLLKALVGEGTGDEKLFSSECCLTKYGISSELENYIDKLKEQYGLYCCREQGMNPQAHRDQLLDALFSLFCRSDVSAETLWDGGWLLRQLLPYSMEEFNSHHLKLLEDLYKSCTNGLLGEITGSWCDVLVEVLIEEWKKCKKAIEASAPQTDLKCLFLPPQTSSSEGESSFASGERMYKMVKVFVLGHQIRIFCTGETLPDEPPMYSPLDILENSRAKSVDLDVLGPKLGTEINIVDAVPCRIAFGRGKERHFCFVALSIGISGWLLLAEELPLKQGYGVVRVAAPLAGSNPRIDDKRSKWLHLCIRPLTLPFIDTLKSGTFGRAKSKPAIDGRWILAFRDEQSCKWAESMILEKLHQQGREVEKRLHPLLELDRPKSDLDTSGSAPESLPEVQSSL